jgi:hypothetical protein
MRKSSKTLKVNRETLHLMHEAALGRVAVGLVNTGATDCPVGNTRLCCTLNVTCP